MSYALHSVNVNLFSWCPTHFSSFLIGDESAPPLVSAVFANVHVCECVHVCTYVHAIVCVCRDGGKPGDVGTDTFDRVFLEVYLKFYISPEDNLTCCQDLQGSRDEGQVCEGQVTWLELGQPALLKLVAAPAALCSLGCQDDTAPWK